jgi:hypothetical protein
MATVTFQRASHGLVPFPGDRPFGGDDHEVFGARDKETSRVADAWRRHRVTVLHGPAGVGKTSLLQAGVLANPKMAALPIGRVTPLPVFPAAALSTFNPWTFGLLSSWFPFASPAKAAAGPLGDMIRELRHSAEPVLVAIDEADFVFREGAWSPDHRSRLTDQLANAMVHNPDLHLLISVRGQHLDAAREFAAALADDVGRVGLDRFDRAAATEAVSRPLDDGLRRAAETIVRELCTIRPAGPGRIMGTSIVDPAILQITCAGLWKAGVIHRDLPSVRLATEIDEVLAAHCEQALATISADHRVSSSDLLHWVRSTVAEHPGEPVSAPEHGIPDHAAGALEDAHLLSAEPTGDGLRWKLRHPRLLPALHRLPDRLHPPNRPDARTRFRQAERALATGNFQLAAQHVDGALLTGERSGRFKAEAECFLGNLALYQNDADSAAEHYQEALALFASLLDNTAEALLLTALGRLKLSVDADQALMDLRSAADRLPDEPIVQTGHAVGLSRVGSKRAALAVLNDVLARDGDDPEARRTRGEILAELDRKG